MYIYFFTSQYVERNYSVIDIVIIEVGTSKKKKCLSNTNKFVVRDIYYLNYGILNKFNININ